jgi:phosphatidylserine decarboxylase
MKVTNRFLTAFCILCLIPLFSVCQSGKEIIAAGKVPPYRVGEWLPSDQAFLDRWMEARIKETGANVKPFPPVVEEFKNLIERDPEIYMLFNQMFVQTSKHHFDTTPIGTPQVKDYLHMLELISAIITKAPDFDETGLVGFPINAILDWPMGTKSGFAAFLNDKVNAQLKKILNEWAKFLRSPGSCSVLNTDEHKGWFGKDAKKAMPDFEKEFKCEPGKPYYGFTSWDNFFTREFKDGLRPVASPQNDSVIVNACESAPYKIAYNVKRADKFWIKGQPYSLVHMLANDDLVDKFVGGTVYQAFLSALSYHRWHSPVSGKIVKTIVKDGTYYSEAFRKVLIRRDLTNHKVTLQK